MPATEPPSERRETTGLMPLIFFVFFTSGMAGLIYQVAWSRLLHLVVGVSIFAITTVICTFMAGLALGSYVLGRWGDRWRDPLLAYGIIEGVIGLYAALTPWIFQIAEPTYVWAFRNLGPVGLNVFRVGMSALLLLLPTALMGGTLPLLSRAVSSMGTAIAKATGLLYAMNTLGAVAGCFIAGFVLLGEIGISGSVYLAAGLNLLVATVVILARRGAAPLAPTAVSGPLDEEEVPGQRSFILLVFFITGFAALGYEVLWTRALLVYLASSTYAFSLVLSVYLLGVAGGSFAASWVAPRVRRPLYGVALAQFGVAATVLLGMRIFPNVRELALGIVGSYFIDSFARAVGFMATQAGLVLLLPTLFMGATFPFGVAAYRSSKGVSGSVGSLYAVNTLGNIAGSIVVGFFAIAAVGVRNSIVGLLSLNLLIVGLILWWLMRQRPMALLWPAAALTLAWLAHTSTSERLFFDSITGAGNRIVYYREGASDTVAVIERPKVDARALIYSDGRGAAGTDTLHWNLYFGHLPMLMHPNPKEILHICYGSGNSVMSLTRHDPERIDVIELSPHVEEASDYFWTNERVIHDPRVNLIIEDGRNFLLGTDRMYDVISLEPPNIFTAGVVNLYSQEFYESARRHLKPGGIMLQWLPTVETSKTDRGALIRAFTEAFPHVTVWQQLTSASLLLVGTEAPLKLDVTEIERRLQADEMRKDVKAMGIKNTLGLLSFFLLSDESTRKLVASEQVVRDDRTIVDYSMPKFVGSGFGFSIFTLGIGDKDQNPTKVISERLAEYASWGDPASSIVPDTEQAAQLDRAIQLRKTGKLGQLPDLQGVQ